jgi:hypothetical protein
MRAQLQTHFKIPPRPSADTYTQPDNDNHDLDSALRSNTRQKGSLFVIHSWNPPMQTSKDRILNCHEGWENRENEPLFVRWTYLKGLSHEIDFKNFDKNLKNLA